VDQQDGHDRLSVRARPSPQGQLFLALALALPLAGASAFSSPGASTLATGSDSDRSAVHLLAMPALPGFAVRSVSATWSGSS
jgi:hypothetical protein